MSKEDINRRKRINRIKKIIMGIIAVAILIPCCICVVLAVRLSMLGTDLKRTRSELELVKTQLEQYEAQALSDEGDKSDDLKVDETSDADDGVSKFDQESLLSQDDGADDTDPYYIYLTFDDGPSSLTEDILDILREYDAKATFFAIGRDDEDDKAMYSRIVESGHTLGMHSYSHKYDEIYASTDAFKADLDRIRELIKDETGVLPVYYRFPGGSSNNVAPLSRMEEFIDILHGEGIEYIDWNIEAGDASSKKMTADEIVEKVFKDFGKYHTNVVLLHDGSGHEATVEALPLIIERARNMGAKLLPITEQTVPIQHLQ